MCIGLHVNLFLSGFNETQIFLTDLRKKTQISNFMKIHPVGAEWTDRGTDITSLTSVYKIYIVKGLNLYGMFYGENL